MSNRFAIAAEKKPFLRAWETALLLALCVTLLLGLLAGRSQQKLASGLIRLHVIAASDSAEDQQTKLRVRDAVLDALTPELDSAASPRQAQKIIEARLPELAAIGGEISGGSSRATLGWENYPTRQYEGFALPAGRYLSLRVELGEAQGQNWWCVMFPPLCLPASGEFFTEQESKEIEQSKNIEVRFALFEAICNLFTDKSEKTEENKSETPDSIRKIFSERIVDRYSVKNLRFLF